MESRDEGNVATIHPRLFRDCAGEFATGIAVLTTTSKDRQPVGLTINSFSTVSLDPPLVLVSLARSLSVLDIFAEAKSWAIHVLHEGQEALSTIFSQRETDRFADVLFETSPYGNPVLHDTLSLFECVPWAVHDGGDHLIFIGRVVHVHRRAAGRPLVFFRGRYGTVDGPA